MALGALIIQKEYGFSAEETDMQVQENIHLKSFI